MSIRSILVQLDLRAAAPQRIEFAAELARRHEAHLVGVAATGWLEVMSAYSEAIATTAVWDAAEASLREQAEAAVERFRQIVDRVGVPSFESRIDDADEASAMTLAARYCDLSVLTQTDPDEGKGAGGRSTPAEVLLHSGRPVLLLPYAGTLPAQPLRRVLVGWDASREAARALHDALPLLRQAGNVEIVVFESPVEFEHSHGDLPGADIGLWLARHGVKVLVTRQYTDMALGESILSYAADTGADLIVAGGYGHLRFRETVFGGVTRTLLRSSPVPVLLSH